MNIADKLNKMAELDWLVESVQLKLNSKGTNLEGKEECIFKRKDVVRALQLSALDVYCNTGWDVTNPNSCDIEKYASLMVLGASQYLLGGHALLGRVLNLVDNGVEYCSADVLPNALVQIYLNDSKLYHEALAGLKK